MVKPTGALCNLQCEYCYYLHKRELLGPQSNFRMSDAVLEAHVRQYIEGQDGDEVVFTWQGGEPTLLGLDFFEKVIALQQKYRRAGQRIENDLQTNGTLLDESWARFLKKNRFLVGLSIDGPEELHDCYRVTRDGKPTFRKAFAASELLHAFKIPFNTLSVIHRRNAKRPLDVYRFLSRAVGPQQIQFIPCVEPKDFETVGPQCGVPTVAPRLGSSAARPGNPDSIVTEWSVDPDEWGVFLCKVWDDWLRRDYGRVFIALFESAIAQWMGQDALVCCYHEFCGKGLALEHDGSVYSCDHYVYPEYRLGNILEQPSSEMVFSAQQQEFGLRKFATLPRYCRECRHLFACNGECPKNRLACTPDGEPGLNYLCSGLKRFWAHIERDIPGILQRVQQDHSLHLV
jgi:uncharacterized protein